MVSPHSLHFKSGIHSGWINFYYLYSVYVVSLKYARQPSSCCSLTLLHITHLWSVTEWGLRRFADAPSLATLITHRSASHYSTSWHIHTSSFNNLNYGRKWRMYSFLCSVPLGECQRLWRGFIYIPLSLTLLPLSLFFGNCFLIMDNCAMSPFSLWRRRLEQIRRSPMVDFFNNTFSSQWLKDSYGLWACVGELLRNHVWTEITEKMKSKLMACCCHGYFSISYFLMHRFASQNEKRD